MQVVICPYCGKQAAYIDSKVIYGKSYGMIYLCCPCDAYVGVHEGTDRPLGRLANKDLRKWKMAAHEAFDPLWKSGRMKRAAAYQWLADLMELTRDETHIGMFDIPECMKVIAICNAKKGEFFNG